MSRPVARRWPRVLYVLLAANIVACSSGSGSESPAGGDTSERTTSSASSPSPTTVDPVTSFASTVFAIPFNVSPPSWSSTAPSEEQRNFVTWESADQSRAVRFLAPVNVYRPGETRASAIPADYLGYLLAQRSAGADFTNVAKSQVGEKPATLLTATTSSSLDGSLGCQQLGLPAADCYGLQSDLVLRIAVIDLGERVLLVWQRSDAAQDNDARAEDMRTFEKMLATLRFSDP